MRFLSLFGLGLLAVFTYSSVSSAAPEPGTKYKVLIIDGQNNHNWRETTPIMKKLLESSGRFTVEVATTAQEPALPPKPGKADAAAIEKFRKALDNYADEYALYLRTR